MRKYIYLLAMSLCLGLVSCGDDEDEIIEPPVNTDDGKGKDDTQEQKNADLIGWWITPEEYSNGNLYRYRLGIHFIDDQVVEYGELFMNTTMGNTYATMFEGVKYYWYVGNDMAYCMQNTAYERNGNVIKLSDGWTITIVKGKLYFSYSNYTATEYNKITTTN